MSGPKAETSTVPTAADPRTLHGVVPLATVVVQQGLASAGVRSLAIKGPCAAALGIRPPKVSHDIDLLVPPDCKSEAAHWMHSSGWWKVMPPWPDVMDDVIYSVTYAHPNWPSPVDIHHRFPGLLGDAKMSFEKLWKDRVEVQLAHQAATTTSPAAGLIIEALHAMRQTLPNEWPECAALVAQNIPANTADTWPVKATAALIGAADTAYPLIAALEDGEDTSGWAGPSPEQRAAWKAWELRCGRRNTVENLFELARRRPGQVVQMCWSHAVLPAESARFWATTQGRPYRGRLQVMVERAKKALRQWRAALREGRH